MLASPTEETFEEFVVRNGLEVFVEGIHIKIGEDIGAGGQGFVRKATMIHSELAGGHEVIVKILGVYATSVNSRNQRGIVLEYCAGGSLDKVIEKAGYQMVQLVPMYDFYQISWIEQIIGAVKHIHDLGIIHRDLKPANILFTSTDLKTLKICDFSDCTTLPEKSAVVEHTSERGTPGYRDTEIEAGRDYGNKADVFSLGRTILSILFKITPEAVAKIGEPSFFRTFCEIFAGRETVHEAPSVGFDASVKDEYRKKLAIIQVNLRDKLINFATKMYSTDVAERPTMDAACVTLREILDDSSVTSADVQNLLPPLCDIPPHSLKDLMCTATFDRSDPSQVSVSHIQFHTHWTESIPPLPEVSNRALNEEEKESESEVELEE